MKESGYRILLLLMVLRISNDFVCWFLNKTPFLLFLLSFREHYRGESRRIIWTWRWRDIQKTYIFWILYDQDLWPYQHVYQHKICTILGQPKFYPGKRMGSEDHTSPWRTIGSYEFLVKEMLLIFLFLKFNRLIQ